MNQKHHVILCGYRDWALNAFSRIEAIADSAMWNIDFSVVKSPQELTRHHDVLTRLQQTQPDDVIFCAGWSWILPRETVESNLCVGVHPSDLPAFAGGSPIQHQVLCGVRNTKASLFRMRHQLDAGEVVCKSDITLDGHMTDVFKELERVTVDLFVRFWTARREERLTFTPQHVTATPFKRLKPEDSRVTGDMFMYTTCAHMWDRIRCREDPYPNAYLEDFTGRLTFKRVEFEPATSDAEKKP